MAGDAAAQRVAVSTLETPGAATVPGDAEAASRPVFPRVVFRLRQFVSGGIVGHLRLLYWRALGLHAGRNVSLRRIAATWPHQVRIGSDSVIEQDVVFKFDGTWCPGPRIVFGDGAFIGARCEFNIRVGLTVGRHALIASGCCVVDHDHGFASRAEPMSHQADGAEAAIAIGDDVWIGANVVILKGVAIGTGAIVGAGSVVTRSVGAYEIWAGSPARKIGVRPL